MVSSEVFFMVTTLALNYLILYDSKNSLKKLLGAMTFILIGLLSYSIFGVDTGWGILIASIGVIATLWALYRVLRH